MTRTFKGSQGGYWEFYGGQDELGVYYLKDNPIPTQSMYTLRQVEEFAKHGIGTVREVTVDPDLVMDIGL